MTTPASADPHRLTDEASLREIVGVPGEGAIRKQLAIIDVHARTFIGLSPFLVISTADADGKLDASPRGDPPGFVRVLDDTRLLIPDRRGNRRIDTMTNLVVNPRVGLIFMVPGVNETLRINGRGMVTDDADLLAGSEVQNVAPKLGILVEVEELYFHCARAFLRSGLWDPARWPDRSALPSLGKILVEQTKRTDMTAADMDESLEAANRKLY